MNDIQLTPSWINGNYIVLGFQVSIKTSLSIARFYSISDDEDYYFQGPEGDSVIDEIFNIWNNSSLKQDEAVAQWIRHHLI